MNMDQKKRGPHGGIWIKTIDGFVEIHVFETNLESRFRLYFFNLTGNPVSPQSSNSMTLDTLWADGTQESFRFKQKEDFLEATSTLREPHEFEVSLNIVSGAHVHKYVVLFTEEHHDHGHPQEAHEHAHHHGNGVLSKLHDVFGHSHKASDKIDESMESNELGIKTLKITLMILLMTAMIQLGIVLASGSVSLLADTIHNFGDATTSIPLWIAFSLARRGTNRKFTYGYGKAEDVAGIIIVLIIFFSACIVAYESMQKIIHPVPMDNIEWVAFAAIIGFLGNEWVALYRIRVGKAIGSAALVADGYHARVDGFTSLAVLLGVMGTWFGLPIVDPLVGIFITIAILFIVRDAAKSVWIRLIDGIEPEILAQIEHAPTHIMGVNGVQDVRARWVGHRVYADVIIYVDPSLSVSQADGLSKKVEHALRVHVPILSTVVVQIKPDSLFQAPHNDASRNQ